MYKIIRKIHLLFHETSRLTLAVSATIVFCIAFLLIKASHQKAEALRVIEEKSGFNFDSAREAFGILNDGITESFHYAIAIVVYVLVLVLIKGKQ